MTLTNLDKTPWPWFEDGTVTVDAEGRVWRHRANGRDLTEPRRIDLPDRSRGYRNVVLPLDGKWRTFKAHRLVWAWFNGGPPPDGSQIDHLNGDKGDNRPENLELVTPSENIRRSYANGRRRPWSDATEWRGRPRLTTDQIDTARGMRSEGATLREVAAATGCSITHARRITTAAASPHCLDPSPEPDPQMALWG